MRVFLGAVSILLLGCAEAKAPDLDCAALTTVDAITERCLGGSPSGDFIATEYCFPFSEPRRYSGVLITGFEWSEFYPDVGTYAEADRDNPTYWFEQKSGTFKQQQIDDMKCTHDCAFIVNFVGRESLCEYGYGHLGLYPKMIIGERDGTIKQLDLTVQVDR